jgi:hypothetical protein
MDRDIGSSVMGKGSILRASLWMFLLSIVLFWLPVAGPFIAGVVGGRMAGSAGRGITAALLPAAIVAVLAFIVAAIFALPVVGAVAGFGIVVVAIIQSIPLLAGAIIGGIL